jgi:hypothetical protein
LEIQKYLLKSKEGKKNLISRKIGKLGDVVNQWSFSSRFMTTTKQLFLSNRRKLIRGGGALKSLEKKVDTKEWPSVSLV